MASESTVVSDHSPAPEQQLEKVNEEVKKIEQEGGLPPSSGSGEEEKLKAEELPSQPAPSPELEEKIEEKQIEPSLAEEVKKTEDTPVSDVSVENKPDTSGVPESVADSIKSQPEDQPKIESIEKQPEEQPAIEAVEKQPEEAPKMGDVTEPSVVADSAKSQPEEQLPTESVEKLPQEQPPPVEVAEKQPEEQPKISDTPEPSVEAVEKTELVEVLPVKESETVVVKDTENSQAEPKKEEIPEPAPEPVPEEQSEVAEQVEPKESVKVEIAKDEETLTDKSEFPPFIEEQTTQEEPVETESSDQITPTMVEAQDPPTVVTKDANVDDKEKELSGSNVLEGFSKEEVVESGKVELESEGKNVKTEEKNEGKKVITEESDEHKTDKLEDVNSSISPTEVTAKSLEVDNTSRDIELAAENGEEGIKDETEKNGEVEGKVDEVTTSKVKEPVEEPKKSETEVKGQETEQTDETKLEKEKEAGEIAKPDVPPPESLANDGDETKISQDPPKEEPSTKPIKQSNNLIAKVKQSLVKAKKAIIGKSPNSKTVSS